MNRLDSPAAMTRRDDLVVSVCITDITPSPTTFAAIQEFAKRLESRYRFNEMIVVVGAEHKEAFHPLIRSVPNLRLFSVTHAMSRYQRRVVGAQEAIGDVVLIASLDDLDSLDAIAMLDQAADKGQLIIGLRAEPHGMERFISLPLMALGRAAGFKVGLLFTQTLALPRTLINHILDHSAPDLALRFPPRDPRIPLGFVTGNSSNRVKRETSENASRLGLIQTLVVYMAPRVLAAVISSSLILTLLGLGFAVYVLGVWLFVSDIAQGWLTTSMMLSLTALFFGVSVFGLSIGLQHLIQLQRRDRFENVVEEVNKIDLFGHVASELNVDLDLQRRK